jgi:hypothetical protein
MTVERLGVHMLFTAPVFLRLCALPCFVALLFRMSARNSTPLE